ncbi:acyl carrier protein [Immundisolibacter sp.]|jgi:acyl carrier protein|uniref:acyl carrier protein n=1 Tax=Immundisolibacter sp. TaxID=1934948 RepID=UPI002B0E7F86|nr:acyl carrier protein [Immundisolibacter sp.]MEA3221108.1 Acyl carrier protein [Immundisolibacter sp.]
MTEAELRERLLAILGAIAPEAREIDIDPEQSFRDQLDIDSMDFLNFVTAVHKQLGVPIPELEYPRLASLNGAVHYLMKKLPG